MDLYLKHASATEEERTAVDAVLGPPATRWEGGDRKRAEDGHISYGGRDARSQRHLLLPVLNAVQKQLGWISDGSLNYVAQRLTVPPAEVYGVATFYAMLSTQPRPKRVAHVCDDIACRIGGANPSSSNSPPSLARPVRRTATRLMQPGSAAPASACANVPPP
ncbi:MAG: NAD(P)H-dependent oxidoreductase subunit E [Hymenobacter sp.]